MFLLILLAIIVVGGLLYLFRVPLLAKVLGQPESRIRRQLRHKQ